MPARLKIENYPDFNVKDNAQLKAAVVVGATSATLDGAPDIDTGDFCFFGRVGQQSLDPVEKRQVTMSGVTATVAALTYDHPQYSPVKAVYGDKIQVYRAANVDGTPPADSAFSALGSPVDIDPGQAETEFNDGTGSSSFWYKHVFYNSTTATEVTDLSDVTAQRGEEYGNYTTIADIRKEAGMQNNPYISDEYLRKLRTEAEDVINTALSGTYTIPFSTPIPALIARCAKLLAAGYALKRDYGQGLLDTASDGQAKIDEVLGTKEKPGLLQGIIDGTFVLVGVSGSALSSRDAIHGWPDSTTADTDVEDGGSKRHFRMDQVF